MSDRVSERRLGYFPLSIATSIAIEKILGYVTDDTGMTTRVASMPISGYNKFWVNVATLYRNMFGAMEKDQDFSVSSMMYAAALVAEMAQIRELVKEHAPEIEVVFYVANHRNIATAYPGAVLREQKGQRQLEYRAKMIQSIGYALSLAEKSDNPIRLFSNDALIHGSYRVLLLSHMAIDLLSEPRLHTLDLLESHTGAIKPKALWYSKLITAKQMPNIPFNKLTLVVFGDSETFSPQPHAIKTALLSVADKKYWTAVTSYERVKAHLSEVKDLAVREHLKLIVR